MADIIILRVFIGLEVISILIDGVVCQMHVKIVEIAFERANILVSCKSGESFSEDKGSQRIDSIDQHIYA